MKLKRRFKRFKYTLSWKYPRFYALCYVLVFPLQLVVLLVLFFTVSFLFNTEKSDDFVSASAQQSKSKKAGKLQNNFPTITTVSETIADSELLVSEADTTNADQTSSSDPADNLTDVKLSATMPRLKRRPTETELDVTPPKETRVTVASKTATDLSVISLSEKQPDVVDPVDPVDPVDDSEALAELEKLPTETDTSSITSEATLRPVNQESRSPDQVTNETADFRTSGLYNENWINAQRSGLFVVQLVSSPKYSALIDYGRTLSSFDSVTIYPYRKNENGETVYGISTGLYQSAREAIENIETFPASIREGKPWVRKVEELKALISDPK